MHQRRRSSTSPLRHVALLALGAVLAVEAAGCGRSDPRPTADSAASAGSVDPAAVAAAPASAPLGDTALATSEASTATDEAPTTADTAAPDAGSLPPAAAPASAPPAVRQPPARTPQAQQPPVQQAAPQQPAPRQQQSQQQVEQPSPPQTVALAPGATPPPRDPVKRAAVPFAPGERYVYDVKFGAVDVGDGVMEVLGVEDVRGREAYHVLFRVNGGTMFYKVRDRYESWIDTQTLASLRHIQDIDEGSYERTRHFEIYPERGVYRENDKPETPTVNLPLDDGSFFFFVRTVPLEVGQTYEFHRYFKPDRNPVKITVLRRERVKVPAGTFDAVVVQPTIKTKGVFGEGGRAEIWIADDSTRAMLQMKSKLKFGSLNLYLKQMRPASR